MPSDQMPALMAARMWAADHGHPQPDDRMLMAYGDVLIQQIADAVECNVRHEDPDQQDRGGFLTFTPRMAYVAGHDKAAAIVRGFREVANRG